MVLTQPVAGFNVSSYQHFLKHQQSTYRGNSLPLNYGDLKDLISFFLYFHLKLFLVYSTILQKCNYGNTFSLYFYVDNVVLILVFKGLVCLIPSLFLLMYFLFLALVKKKPFNVRALS